MYKLNPNVLHKVVKDNKILMVELDNPANAILEIEGVSAGVFLSILNGDSEQVIIERICAEYDTSHEQVVKDVETFIKHLIDRKILLPG